MRLLERFERGALALRNRVVMAPMTRARAGEGGMPHPRAADYYAQRASAGLIITEGSQVSAQAVGYIGTPGCHSPEQIAAWNGVCEAVHRAGGRIFLQLWHVGRISHPDLLGGELPVGPSPLRADAEAFTPTGPKPTPTPRALEASETPGIVAQFERAARNAKQAGFDGVEIHGANGYLLDQFLRDGANQRGDAYGGSIANRARLPLEVTEAVIGVWGAERVSYRISPHFAQLSMSDSDSAATFGHFVRELARLRLGFLHLVEPIAGPAEVALSRRLAPALRELFDGVLVLNGGYSAPLAERALLAGAADLISFGAPFIANPDLVERFACGASLSAVDPATMYGGDEKGYVDYPRAHGLSPG